MNLAEKIEELHRTAHRHWMKNSGSLGLSFSEFEYLSAIREREILAEQGEKHSQHLHDIVQTMGVNKASASAMMDKLEKRKLVRIKPCKRDARAKHFSLSPKGEELRLLGKKAYDALVATEAAKLEILLGSTPSIESVATSQPEAKAEPQKKKRAEKPAKAKPQPIKEETKELPQLSLFG